MPILKHLLNTLTPKTKVAALDAKLQFSELRYRRLFETAQDGILILDATTGKIIAANPFLKKLVGYPDHELLGKELWQIGAFKDIVGSKKAFLELQTKGYIRYKDLPLQTKDGKSIDVEFISNVYMADHEKVIQCNIRDITNRKKAEKAVEARTKELEVLTKSQEETNQAMLNVMEDLETTKNLIEIAKAKDEAMLASIGEGLIAVDNERKILVMNKAAEQMLGWKMEELIGKDINTLPLADEEGNILPLEKRPAFIALLQNKITNNIYYFVKKDKTRFPIAIMVTPIKLGRKIIGALDVFRDITHEKEVDRAKSEFVSLASHQLRTPLGIAKWYLEAIKGETSMNKTSQQTRDYLDQVYKSNERLLSLVRDLLSISRIDQGKIKNTPQKVNIADLIERVMKEMNILALKTKIALHLQIKIPQKLTLYIDPLRSQEVIENLIANALTYSTPNKAVTVIVSIQHGQLSIAVEDRGIGISEADKKMLFTKFFRSEKAIAKNAEGSGLGLYVVKSYVEEWGGTISVKSKEGRGSTFTIILPLQSLSKEKSKSSKGENIKDSPRLVQDYLAGREVI